MDMERIPRKGTLEELKILGARHLTSDEFEIEKGKMGRIEYMVYEDPAIAIVWKKPFNGNQYLIHKRLKAEEIYPVPAVIKP